MDRSSINDLIIENSNVYRSVLALLTDTEPPERDDKFEPLMRRTLDALSDEFFLRLAQRLERSVIVYFRAAAAGIDPSELTDAVRFVSTYPQEREYMHLDYSCAGCIADMLLHDVISHFFLGTDRRHGDADDGEVDDEKFDAYVNAVFEEKLADESLFSTEVETLISQLPGEYVMPDTALSREMTAGRMEGGELEMVVKPQRKLAERPVVTRAVLTFDGDNASITSAGRTRYTPYDRAVYSGIVSLYEAGNTLFTPAMVYRAMNGLNESEYISPTTLQKVKNSIEKSRRSQLSIDFTEEAQLYAAKSMLQPGPDFKTTYEGNLLAADRITVRNNGISVTGYKILRKPILYEYAQKVNQVITVPIGLLQTKAGVRSTEEVIVLREYLLRRIENFRRRRSSGAIRVQYEDIYALAGISRDTHKNFKDKCKKLRSHTEAILGEWVSMNYIASFESRKTGGRNITEVEIRI